MCHNFSLIQSIFPMPLFFFFNIKENSPLPFSQACLSTNSISSLKCFHVWVTEKKVQMDPNSCLGSSIFGRENELCYISRGKKDRFFNTKICSYGNKEKNLWVHQVLQINWAILTHCVWRGRKRFSNNFNDTGHVWIMITLPYPYHLDRGIFSPSVIKLPNTGFYLLMLCSPQVNLFW